MLLYFLLLPKQRKNLQRAADDDDGAEGKHVKALSAADHSGVGEACRLGGLRRSNNGTDNCCTYCAGKLQQRVHGSVTVSVETLRQLAKAVGHNRAHGKALAEGKEQVKNYEEQGAELARIQAVADNGNEDGAVA